LPLSANGSAAVAEVLTSLAADLNDNSALGRALSATGQLEDAQGRKAEAAAQYQRSAAAYRAAGANFETGVSSLALARVSTDLSNFPAALKAGFEAIRMLSSTPPRQGAAALAAALDAVGTVFHRLEQPVKALDYYRQALDLRTKNVPAAVAESYALIGVELDKIGAHPEALDYLQKALDARRQARNPVLIAGALTNLAVVQDHVGNAAVARQNFTEALTLIASIFGMNVPVPGEEQEFAFLGILILMAVILLVLVAYFRRRGWL
jgi:tetratricopeptide (TPR) repeat protein